MQRFMSRSALTGLIIGTISAVLPMQAQVGGTISGFVKDPSGAIVPGAIVTAVLTGQSLTRSAVSDTTGFFNLLSMQPGVYDVSTTAPGFDKQVQGGVRLTSGENLRLDVAIKVGSLTSEIAVTSTANHVYTTNQTLSGLVEDRRVHTTHL